MRIFVPARAVNHQRNQWLSSLRLEDVQHLFFEVPACSVHGRSEEIDSKYWIQSLFHCLFVKGSITSFLLLSCSLVTVLTYLNNCRGGTSNLQLNRVFAVNFDALSSKTKGTHGRGHVRGEVCLCRPVTFEDSYSTWWRDGSCSSKGHCIGH